MSYVICVSTPLISQLGHIADTATGTKYLDSLGPIWFIRVDLISLGPTWTHLDSLGLTWTLELRPTWTCLDPLGLAWTRLEVVSFSLTWHPLDSLRHTWTIGLIWTQLKSLGLTWTHLDSLGLT